MYGVTRPNASRLRGSGVKWPDGRQWLLSWMGLTATPPILLALVLLARWTPEAGAQITYPTISPTEIYEDETLEFTITLSRTQADAWEGSYRNSSNINGNDTGSALQQKTSGGSGDWYFATSDGIWDDDIIYASENKLAENENDDGTYTLTFYVHANADSISEADEVIGIEVVAGYSFPGTVRVTLKDGARPSSGNGVTISPTSLALTELGASSAIEKTYTVVLDTDPTDNFTITVANGDIIAVEVDTNAGTSGNQNTLTFTAGGDGSGTTGNGNWAVAQTVTVQSLNDADALGETFNITHSATATGSTAPYHGITIDPVAITTTNAGHGVVVSESSLSVAENDETATYTVVLKSQPGGNVEISTTSGATATATASPATLTFGSSNWNTPQTVTVTGVADSTDNPGGGRDVSISHAASSTDPNYTIASAGTIEARVTDDDATTVTLSGGAVNMGEGESQTFIIILGRGLVQGETLTVPLTFGGTATRGTDYTMTGTSATGVQYNNLDSGNATVVFTGPESGATTTAATITLSAASDSTAESTAETVDISLGSITHTGLSNAGGVTQTASLGDFTIADPDGPPTGVGITESGGSTSVTEAAGQTNTDTYTVVLKIRPTATVAIAVTSGDPGAVRVIPATLTFAPTNWNTSQTVTVTGMDDNVDQTGNRSVTVTHSATSTDTKYNGNTIAEVTATVVDDDNTAPSALPAVELAAAAYSGGEASGNRTINVAGPEHHLRLHCGHHSLLCCERHGHCQRGLHPPPRHGIHDRWGGYHSHHHPAGSDG